MTFRPLNTAMMFGLNRDTIVAKNDKLQQLRAHQMGDLYKQAQWSGLQTIVRVVRTRHLWNKSTQEVMFYLSSLPPEAQQLGKAIRQHW